ncbi:CRISPR system precrRNA processing endoribonuclease RAMP protein Cas6 [Methylotuvimicrobium sp. KM2]|uniref:CRISPR system precrRNA processing endoribonuclease RAMP protein Cas6 n=1 Tax=Methylotuvimicrobium sp. KM2 TaxID=3133976 RepID=UPI00310158E0
MQALTAHRYQFNCRALESLRFGFYSGSMLRGAFGNALRKTVCVTRLDDCNACLLQRQCNYPKVFETPPPRNSTFQQFSRIPQPFVLEPPPMGAKHLAEGEPFAFNLVLIGQAVACLPIIIFAIQRALEHGLGKHRAKAELVDVVFEPGHVVETKLYCADEGQLLSAPAFQLPALDDREQITLQVMTPLRIQQKGQILSEKMTGKDFLMALIRRYYLLQEFHGIDYQSPDFHELAKQAEAVWSRNRFSWCQWKRYSSRQKQTMSFTGVLGEMQLTGPLSSFLPYLTQGQWLHVGNKTTFGMGGYRIID